MTWLASSAILPSRLSAFKRLVRVLLARIFGAFGRAKLTSRTQRLAGWQLSRRDYLAEKIRKARKQHRQRKALCSEAMKITHGILANGPR